MRVIDTSAWIEWLSASPLAEQIIPLLPDDDAWLVPTIVQFELTKWLLRGQFEDDRADQVIASSALMVVAPLTTDIALAAAQLGRQHHLPTADAIVYATALANDADIVTCDKHFDGIPSVIYVPKMGPAA